METQLFPHFQPIFETASGKIRGYEALARKHDNEGKVVSAGALFCDKNLALLERRELDRHVRKQAIAAARLLPDDCFISINISPEWLETLESLDYLPTLEMMMAEGVKPEQLIIEITEQAAHIADLTSVVQRYREAGVRVAIDDFGDGFSQLDRVVALKPDIIKLDIKLLRSGAQGGQSTTMVQMIGELGNRLGAELLCEGVETEQEFHFALSCNASYIQGFLFEKAEPEFTAPTKHHDYMMSLLAQHLDLAVETTSRMQWQRDKVKAELLSLRELLLARQGELQLEDYIPTPNLLRFYICDRRGRQNSPNYENHDGSWHIDWRHRGYNWSWRPYFFQLVGEQGNDEMMTTSSPYIDIHSRRQCMTSAVALDSERILLADIAAPETRTTLAQHFIESQNNLMAVPG